MWEAVVTSTLIALGEVDSMKLRLTSMVPRLGDLHAISDKYKHDGSRLQVIFRAAVN